jgi:peptide deformylase
MPPFIIQKENPVLRQTAEPVDLEAIATPKIQGLLTDMSAALASADDGVALAAPQIGQSLQIFIVSGKMINEENPPPDLVFINPTIIKMSRTKKIMEEGCLSVRWIYGHVKRAERVSVEAYDREGKKFVHHGSGLLAQIFQHEMDHLSGTLFIDKATDMQEIKPESVQ